MRRMSVTMLTALLFGIVLAVSAHAAEETAPACKTAEVNPVTGHVFCIDPLGAPVAPPPPADPCKHDRADAEWTWQPSCAEPKGS